MRKIITLLVTIAVTLHIVAPYNQAYASESEENCNYLSKIDNLQGLLELEKSFAYKYLYMSRETNDDFYDYPWDIMVKVVLTVGDTYVSNSIGLDDKLDKPPVVVNGVTFVPLRYMAESNNRKVTWYPETKTIVLEKNPY